MWSFYYSFIVHLQGSISIFRIAVVTCMTGNALAFSCGMTVNVVLIGRGSMNYPFWLQHTVAFRQASSL